MNLNYKVFGEGFPVIILHGLFGMLDNWQAIGKRLASEGFMVYLVDQRDHGKSPFSDRIDYPTLAADLAAFMEAQWIYKAHIVGHSMGGKTAMQFCFDHEEMVESLVVVDICNKVYPGGHEVIFSAINEAEVGKKSDREEIYTYLMERLQDEVTVQFLLKNIQRRKEGGYEWKMNVALLEASYNHILGKVGTVGQVTGKRSLFIRGERSNYVSEPDLDLIISQFPHSTVRTIPNAGHWVHADQPSAFTHEVVTFLKDEI
ncbi:MAG: alpha/beta fold hydrolase [Saprospiraceae bacterium]|nr:alpha/beta fold hydrolase [Saprospiraceae bacterium]